MRFYEVHAKSVLNRVPEQSRMPFRWTINPYRGCSHACNFCFARPTHTFLGFNPGRDFEREIVVKVNAPEVLRVELARALVEARARGARDEHRPVPVGGGPLPADGGHLGGAARRGEPVLGADEVAAATAGSAADARNRAARELQRMPVDPDARRAGVAGHRAAYAEPSCAPGGGCRAQPGGHPDGCADRAADAGNQRCSRIRSSRCWSWRRRRVRRASAAIALHLRGEVREVFMDWLRSQRPDLVSRYEELYRRRAYAPQEERERLARMVRRGGAPGAFWRRSSPRADSGSGEGAGMEPVGQQERLF